MEQDEQAKERLKGQSTTVTIAGGHCTELGELSELEAGSQKPLIGFAAFGLRGGAFPEKDQTREG